jgi:hypothetical protein
VEQSGSQISVEDLAMFESLPRRAAREEQFLLEEEASQHHSRGRMMRVLLVHHRLGSMLDKRDRNTEHM